MSLRNKGYDDLPALAIRGPELRRSLRRVTISWMFGSVWMVCISNPTMLNFADLAGFTPVHWGLLTSVGFAATLAQFPASYLIERTGFRKWQFIYSMTAGRLSWMLVGLMPLALFVWPAGLVIAVTLALVLLARGLDQFGMPAWYTWMGDLIPPRIRGRFFARRNFYTVMVQVAATLSLGMLLDFVRRSRPGEAIRPQEEPLLVMTLVGVFVVAGVMGAMDILTFLPVRELARRSRGGPVRWRQILSEPLGNPRFLRYAGSAATLTLGMAISAPFFGLTCQKYLKLPFTMIAIITMVCGPVGSVLSSRHWGRLIDRWGRRPVLLLSSAGTVLAVWGWLIIPPSRPGPLDHAIWGVLGGAGLPLPAEPASLATVAIACAVTFYGGVIWTGVGQTQLNMLLNFSDEGGKSAYAAAIGVVGALAGIAGSHVGGLLAHVARGVEFHLGPRVFVNYHLMFVLSGTVRGMSVLWLLGMPDPGAKPARQFVRSLGANVFHSTILVATWPARLVSWSGRTVAQAARNLGNHDQSSPGAGVEREQSTRHGRNR